MGIGYFGFSIDCTLMWNRISQKSAKILQKTRAVKFEFAKHQNGWIYQEEA